ncbi:WG repeat-containing protein [Saccharibacillus brassicae]|uniref:WG repeat-containing protein n=1 Tax=Saccharibacillus brassicae TaxID=2583377 RepID=A0A4Y6V1P6_SACBS|nr:WG repeat-containing protein [Saccharibacillus brassicae]QDH22175.1 WG repeat-containing protein [Saccharibacillus brassicae]
MKKWTTIVLAAALTVTAAPVLPSAHAADSPTSIVNGTAKPVSYELLGGLSDGAVSFWNKSTDRYGFLDTNGKTIVTAQYNEVKPFSEGLAAVRKGMLWGFVDKKGKMVVKPQYERVVEGFSGGLAAVKKTGGKWTYIDKTGRTKLTAAYDEVHEFKDGMAVVWKRKGASYLGGFIDLTGKEIVKPQYAMVNVFSEGLAPVMKNGKWGYIDKKGKSVIKPQFDGAAPFSEGLALFLQNGKYGYVNAKGKVVVKAQYTGGQPFSEGRAAVKVGGSANDRTGKWGYIGVTGKLVIPAQFTDENAEIGAFKEGVAFVQRADFSKVLIDRFGRVLVDLQSDDVTVGEFQNGAAVVNAPVGPGHYYFMQNPLKSKK